jgi:hypothetical protein
MKRLALLVLALGILVAACGDDGSTFTTPTASSTTEGTEPTSTTEPGTTTTTTEPPPSTTDTSATTSTSTTTTSTTTTTTAPETVYLVDTTDFFPDPFPGSGGAHGSGCVTPGFATLPNGVWFGFAEGVGGGNITFDLACFYTGPAACDAQIEDGFVTDPADCLDFWVRNNVAATFAVPLAPSARVWYVDMTSGDVSSPAEIPLADWPTPDSFQDCPGDYCSVWLYVNGGRITGIVEQYLP